MQCFFCTRPLRQATVLLNGHPVGPDCARKHNLLASSGNKRIQRAPKPPAAPKLERDPHTADMFL